MPLHFHLFDCKKKRKHCSVARARPSQLARARLSPLARARTSQLARARTSQLARARPSPFASALLSACERSRLSKQPRVSTSSFRRTKTTEIKRSLLCSGELLRASSDEPPEEISPEQGRLLLISVVLVLLNELVETRGWLLRRETMRNKLFSLFYLPQLSPCETADPSPFSHSGITELKARSFVVWHSSKNKQEKSMWVFLCQPSNLHISVCLWHFLF